MKYLLWLAVAAAALILVGIMQAGHWAVVGVLFGAILVHEFGHWLLARSFGFRVQVFSVGFGSAPRLYLGKLWGTEFQVTPWLAGGYVDIDPTSVDFVSRPAWKRVLVLLAGPGMNVLTAVVLSFIVFTTVGERAVVPAGVTVRGVDNIVTIARDAGMQDGDTFVSAGGARITGAQELQRTLAAHAGRNIAVAVERDGRNITVDVTPNADGRIGVTVDQQFAYPYKRYGLVDGGARAFAYTWEIGANIASGFGQMLHLAPVPQNAPAGADSLHGIVAVVQLGADAFNGGVYPFVMMVCLLSVNLAFFNLLPIPLLDGGHLVFLAWEKVAGKPLNRLFQSDVGKLGLGLLIWVGLYALFNDLFNPLRFH